MTDKTSIPMYFNGEEFKRIETIASENRWKISATLRALCEDALNGNLTPDLTKRVKVRDENRASLHTTKDFKARLDAYKASSEGLSMSEILMRIVEAYEAKNTTQGAAK